MALTPAAAGQPAVVAGGLAPVPGDASYRRSNVPAYVLMGLGGAGMIVGAAFGALALKDKSNFNAHPTQDGADTEKRDARISDGALFGGLGVAAVGVVLLVTNLGPPAQAAMNRRLRDALRRADGRRAHGRPQVLNPPDRGTSVSVATVARSTASRDQWRGTPPPRCQVSIRSS